MKTENDTWWKSLVAGSQRKHDKKWRSLQAALRTSGFAVWAADVSGSRQQEVIRSIPCVRRMTRHEGTLGAARRAALRRRVLRATVILS